MPELGSRVTRSEEPGDQLRGPVGDGEIDACFDAALELYERTTREAAAAVFLSPKTIEYHLRNVYRKLGVSSRGALAETLGG